MYPDLLCLANKGQELRAGCSEIGLCDPLPRIFYSITIITFFFFFGDMHSACICTHLIAFCTLTESSIQTIVCKLRTTYFEKSMSRAFLNVLPFLVDIFLAKAGVSAKYVLFQASIVLES